VFRCPTKIELYWGNIGPVEMDEEDLAEFPEDYDDEPPEFDEAIPNDGDIIDPSKLFPLSTGLTFMRCQKRCRE
jgi:hypothetical protein